MNKYSELIASLNNRTRFGIKLGLENISSLLARLDMPQDAMRFIHIAGTNGKGSVAAMLSAVLTESGINTGLYTSPHLVSVTERIRVNEKDITEEELTETAERVMPYAPGETTYFELLTAFALDFFRRKNVRIAVMEAGMGGRLDATNICFGDIAVITDVSPDHTMYLGETINDIMKEKEAIIKPGSIAVRAEDIADNKLCGYKTNLIGRHQRRNCRLALAAVEALRRKRYTVPDSAVRRGLLGVRWPARFEIIKEAPLVILDGAHNPGAANALFETITEYTAGEKVTLVIGMMRDKDYKGVMDILKPAAKRIIAVTPSSCRALGGDSLLRLAGNIPAEHIPSAGDAVAEAEKTPPVLVTGSLYLAGEVISVYRSAGRCLL